jgi:hypothetical protein
MYCIEDGSSSSDDATVRNDIRILSIILSHSQPLVASTSNKCHQCVCSSKCIHATGRTSSISLISVHQIKKSVNSGLFGAEIVQFDPIELKQNETKENQRK